MKKFAPPELPKTVLLEPPSVALISAPFPDCIRTTITMRQHVMIWTTVTNVVIGLGFSENGGGPQVQACARTVKLENAKR